MDGGGGLTQLQTCMNNDFKILVFKNVRETWPKKVPPRCPKIKGRGGGEGDQGHLDKDQTRAYF